MIAALFVCILAVLLGGLGRFSSHWLKLAFLLLTIFLGVRYMWGADMHGYYAMFKHYSNYSVSDVFDGTLRGRIEPGWVILNILCKPIGFVGLQFVLAIFQNFIIYKIVKENVSPNWYWLSVFIYCFNPLFFVLSASMMRQALAMCVIVLASHYIVKKNIIVFILLIFLAGSFHKSAYLFLPAYCVTFLNLNISYKHVLFVLLFFIFWFLLSAKLFGPFAFLFLENSDGLGSYIYYMNENEGVKVGLGVLFNILLFFIISLQLNRQSKNGKIYCILAIIETLFTPLYSVGPLLSRVALYFSVFSIIAYPCWAQIKNNPTILKVGIIASIVVVNLKSFFDFFTPDTWRFAFMVYNTIFEYSY